MSLAQWWNRRRRLPALTASSPWRRPLRLQLEELEARSVPSATIFRSANVPLAVPDAETATSLLVVPDSARIGDVNVSLNLVHPRAADLDVFLRAPNGTLVELLSAVEFPRSDGSTPFRPVTLSDEASVAVWDVGQLFAGEFRPEGSLSALIGLDAAGTWRLEVTDRVSGVQGFIADWSLTITDLVQEEPRTGGSAPQLIDTSAALRGSLVGSALEDAFTIVVSEPGRLIAQVAADGDSALRPSLRLFDPVGRELVRSDSLGFGPAVARLDQQVASGAYVLRIASAFPFGSGTTGRYRLLTEFLPNPPLQLPTPPRVGQLPQSVAEGDFNRDGLTDLVSANQLSDDVSVLLGNGDGSFQPQRRFAVGSQPSAVAVADVNRDGRADLLAANRNNGNVSVLLGNGDGTFQPQTRLTVAGNPRALAVGDVNGDHRADVVTANLGSNDVSVLLGNGDGSFQPQQRFAVGRNPYSVALADVNGDHRPDLVTANRNDGDLSVLLGVPGGEGAGAFQPQQRFAAGALTRAVTVADVNGDGRPDLVAANFYDVSVLLGVTGGVGAGAFQEPMRFEVGNDLRSVAAQDVNGDNRLDLVAATLGSISSGTGAGVSVLLGVPGGIGMNSFQAVQRFTANRTPTGASLVDVNKDGQPDIVVANGGSNNLSVLLGNGAGSFQDQRRNAVGDAPFSVAFADVNGDGRLDLIAPNRASGNVSVLLGNGDSTFQVQRRFATGPTPSSAAVGDVNGDGRLDIVTANYLSGDVSVLLGNGDGSFQSERRFATGPYPISVALGDLNGDGRPDVVVANYQSGGVSVLLGNGNGTFQGRRTISPNGTRVSSVVVADSNADNRLDVVCATVGGVVVLRGVGDGSFQNPQQFNAGLIPRNAVAADVNADGRLDLVTANGSQNELNVLLADGNGSFQARRPFPVGTPAAAVAATDVNGDGRADLVAVNTNTNDVSVLLGNQDGSFQAERRFATGDAPRALALADANGDGRPDLVTANIDGDDLSVLLGNGDGSFQGFSRFATGNYPASAQLGDVNGDGRLDVVAVNRNKEGDLSVLLGNGDGSFQSQLRFPTGDLSNTVRLGDVNGDGRLDAVVVNERGNDVSVLLGTGDGSFRLQRRFVASMNPTSLLLADVNGDRRLDLVATNSGTVETGAGAAVSVLLGNGDGSFRDQRLFVAGNSPESVAAGDVNGDGRLDLVVSNRVSGEVVLLAGNGNGTFQAPQRIVVGSNPTTVTLVDINADRRLDLVFVNFTLGNLAVLLGNGDGTFRNDRRFVPGSSPRSVAVADVNADGRPDLISANFSSNDVSVLLGNGDGTFQAERAFAAGNGPASALVGDVNNDGRPDLVSANIRGDDVTVLLSNGDSLVPASSERTSDVRHTPQRGDLDGDGTADTVVLNDAGEILFRRGLPETENLFAPPSIVNPDHPARDLTILRDTGAGLSLAASDVQGDRVSIYRFSEGRFNRPLSFTVGRLPERLVAHDLDGRFGDDLIIANTLGNSVTLAFQQPNGGFVARAPVAVGVTPTDITIANLDGQHGPDVIVSAGASGDVTVLYNDAASGFTRSARYRAGLGPAELQTDLRVLQPLSKEQPISLVAGLFTAGDNAPDLAVIDRGTRQLRLLRGTGGGGLANPDDAFSISTSRPGASNDLPGQIVAADFNGDERLDVAVVMKDRNEVWIYAGSATGTFQLLKTVPAGNAPSGLSIADVNGDEADDLMVGNGFGDVLFILGFGTGEFRPFVRNDKRVPFVAADLDDDGTPEVVVAEAAADVVRFLSRDELADSFTPGVFQRDIDENLVGPGAVALADLNSDDRADLIFANTGSNNVLVYLRQSEGDSFSEQPLSFFAGTSPVGLHVADLNLDGLADLAIANEGSNDVSVLLGSRNVDLNGDAVVDGQDLFRFGPRLNAGKAGPTLVTSGLVDDDLLPDLIATSREDQTATLLTGVGNGFFDDVNATPIQLGGQPVGVDLGGQPAGSDRGFVLLSNGNVVAVDFSSGSTTLVASAGRDSVAFQVVAGATANAPLFFTANADGTVSALIPVEGQYFNFNRPDEELDNPSALNVLRDGTGFDLYVSDAQDGGLVVIRFGIDELVPVLQPVDTGEPGAGGDTGDGGDSIPVVATLTSSAPASTAATNSLLVNNQQSFQDIVVDAEAVFGIEETVGEVIFDEGVVVGAGERLLAKLEEELAALDQVPSPATQVSTNTFAQILYGLDELLRELGWERLPGKEDPRPVPEGWNWLRAGQDALNFLTSLFRLTEETPPAPDGDEEKDPLPQDAGHVPLSSAWALSLLAMVGAVSCSQCDSARRRTGENKRTVAG